MSNTRRNFLAAAGAMAVAAVVTPLEAAVSHKTPVRTLPPTDAGNGVSLYDFTPVYFQKLIGTKFMVSDPQRGAAQLKLTGVKLFQVISAAVTGHPSYRPAAFSLQFQMLSGAVLPQGTYTIQSTQVGAFPLFLVPSEAAKNPTYTATINRF